MHIPVEILNSLIQVSRIRRKGNLNNVQQTLRKVVMESIQILIIMDTLTAATITLQLVKYNENKVRQRGEFMIFSKTTSSM
jgi:hypothetical protein